MLPQEYALPCMRVGGCRHYGGRNPGRDWLWRGG